MRQRLITPLVAMLAGIAIAVAGCSSSDDDDQASAGGTTTPAAAPTSAEAGAKHLLAKDFAEAVKQQGTIVIDVRTPAEFAEGHLEGARNIDIEGTSFSSEIEALDASASYAVYCRSGNRSATAGNMMVAAGITKVVDLYGGITAWTAAGYPVTTV